MTNQIQTENISELAKALCIVQGILQGAVKDEDNPFFKSKYANLEAVWDACRKPLSNHGLSVIQTTVGDEQGNIQLITTLVHSSGQWIRGYLPLLLQKKDPQGVGSALTYARRYALAAIVGIVQVDDDAESAMYRNENHSVESNRKTQVPIPNLKAKTSTATTAGRNDLVCDTCNAVLLLSKAGTTYFCPNWKDNSRGVHKRVPVESKPPHNAEYLPPPFEEGDIPF